jgi:hypothetical protein
MSIIYNVTNKVSATIAEAWLEWMLNEHIPEVMDSNCFYDFKVVRLLEVDDSEGPTYAVQYFAESNSEYNRYITDFAPALRKKSFEKWGEQFIAFRSVMAVVK